MWNGIFEDDQKFIDASDKILDAVYWVLGIYHIIPIDFSNANFLLMIISLRVWSFNPHGYFVVISSK